MHDTIKVPKYISDAHYMNFSFYIYYDNNYVRPKVIDKEK